MSSRGPARSRYSRSRSRSPRYTRRYSRSRSRSYSPRGGGGGGSRYGGGGPGPSRRRSHRYVEHSKVQIKVQKWCITLWEWIYMISTLFVTTTDFWRQKRFDAHFKFGEIKEGFSFAAVLQCLTEGGMLEAVTPPKLPIALVSLDWASTRRKENWKRNFPSLVHWKK